MNSLICELVGSGCEIAYKITQPPIHITLKSLKLTHTNSPIHIIPTIHYPTHPFFNPSVILYLNLNKLR